MTAQPPHRRNKLAIAIIVVIVLIASATITIIELPSGSQSSTSRAAPAPLTLWIEDCATGSPYELSTCSFASGSVGSIQAFNMTTGGKYGENSIALHERFFAVQLNQSDTFLFTFTGSNATDFLVYLDNRTGASPNSPAGEVADYKLDILANESGVDYFAGQIRAVQPGVYIFVFSVLQPEPGNAISFLLRDTDAYPAGSIVMGPDSPESVVFHYSNGETGSSPWGKYPFTIYSKTTVPVNMTAVNAPSGAWIRFVPSYLPSVGPNGANVTMYEAGLTVLRNVANPDNTSMFIDADGPNGYSPRHTCLWTGPMRPPSRCSIHRTSPLPRASGGCSVPT